MFGNLHDTIYTGTRVDPALSRQVQDQWVRFAETGDPSLPGMPWPAYEEKSRWTMMLDSESGAEKDPMPREREILDPVLDYRLNASYAYMNLNVPFMWKAAGKAALLLGLIALVIYLILR